MYKNRQILLTGSREPVQGYELSDEEKSQEEELRKKLHKRYYKYRERMKKKQN
ncbi:hypothetical protein [Ruminococcus sp. FC2018]|uniref:hypothetical protein n=1 Tax=Ruminococcus sp. FC2018 TaxID=1410617 RepID=UPI0012DC7991|nr:hypothetical protein [Ruminococcus sp. FC2018]